MEPVALLRVTRPGPSRGEALAVQIYRDLRDAIASGELSAGIELPSSRQAAEALQVSRNTVNQAYDLLRGEGLILVRPNRRPLVQAMPGFDGTEVKLPVDTPAIDRRTASRWTEDYRAAAFASRDGAMAPGQPDPALFPHEAWSRILWRASRNLYFRPQLFEDYLGHRPLRVALAEQLAKSRGMNVAPEQVLVTSSTQSSLALAALALAKSGDTVLIEDPGYLGARSAFAGAGLELKPISVDKEGAIPPPIGDLRDARLVYLTPSNQFPTGTRLSLARRLEFIELSQRTGSIILEDDYDSEFLWRGREIGRCRHWDRAAKSFISARRQRR